MNRGATILDDRETVELLRDRPDLLAIADAVRATQSRPSRYRRPLLLAAAAAAAIGAALAGLALSGAFGGGATRTAVSHPPVSRGMQAPLDTPTIDYRFSGGTLSSIAVTYRSPDASGAVLQLEVLHSDSPPAELYRGKGASQVVFHEQVAMSKTWSGTLSPSDWAGGCQSGLYSIEAAIYSAGSTIANPFDSTETTRMGSAWFSCDGHEGVFLPGSGLGILFPEGEYTAVDLPTLAQPLQHGRQTTLAAASAAWGTPLPLPSTTLVRPSDAGPVWLRTIGSKTVAVAVTFPAQALMVVYLRSDHPVPFDDPRTSYEQKAKEIAGSRVLDLNGTPAFAVAPGPGPTGAGENPGLVAFQLSHSEVVVMGKADTAALEAVARSILDQAR